MGPSGRPQSNIFTMPSTLELYHRRHNILNGQHISLWPKLLCPHRGNESRITCQWAQRQSSRPLCPESMCPQFLSKSFPKHHMLCEFSVKNNLLGSKYKSAPLTIDMTPRSFRSPRYYFRPHENKQQCSLVPSSSSSLPPRFWPRLTPVSMA